MELIINPPYGLNIGENLEFVANYHKGKKPTYDIMNVRSHFRGVNTGKDMLLYCADKFMGALPPVLQGVLGGSFQPGKSIMSIEFYELTEMEVGHYRNKQYHYYFMNNNPLMVNQWLRSWKESNPLIHLGNLTHMNMNNIREYSWAYEFNGQQY